jgi:hypothetical protein
MIAAFGAGSGGGIGPAAAVVGPFWSCIMNTGPGVSAPAVPDAIAPEEGDGGIVIFCAVLSVKFSV